MEVGYQNGMLIGQGYESHTGKQKGFGVTPGRLETITAAVGVTAGETAYGSMSRVTSEEEVVSHMSIAGGGGLDFGVGGGEASFRYVHDSQVNAYSYTAMIATVIKNATMSARSAVLTADARRLLADGDSERFRERFGDAYLSGIVTGGELYALITINTASLREVESIDAALRAHYGPISVEGSFVSDTFKQVATSATTITYYQAGGSGSGQTGYLSSFEEYEQRARQFADSVRDHPVPYLVLTTPYTDLDLPQPPNPIDVQIQRDVLWQATEVLRKIRDMRRNILYIQTHQGEFARPFPQDLNEASAALTTVYNDVQRNASACYNSISACRLIAAAIPVVQLPERLGDLAGATVPDLVGLTPVAAEAALRGANLKADGLATPTHGGSDAPVTVRSQTPPPGAQVPPGTVVHYRYPLFVSEEVGAGVSLDFDGPR